MRNAWPWLLVAAALALFLLPAACGSTPAKRWPGWEVAYADTRIGASFTHVVAADDAAAHQAIAANIVAWNLAPVPEARTRYRFIFLFLSWGADGTGFHAETTFDSLEGAAAYEVVLDPEKGSLIRLLTFRQGGRIHVIEYIGTR